MTQSCLVWPEYFGVKHQCSQRLMIKAVCQQNTKFKITQHKEVAEKPQQALDVWKWILDHQLDW